MSTATTADHTLTGAVLDEDAGLIRTPTAWLARIHNPLLTPPWGIDRIHEHEIRAAIDAGEYRHPGHHYSPALEGFQRPTCRACDIARIAHLATHGWPTRTNPITVDLGVDNYWPQWAITDGNHRLAAALIRGDHHLTVSACGDWDRAIDVLVHGIPVWDLAA